MIKRLAGPTGFMVFAIFASACGGESTDPAVVDVSGLYRATGQQNPSTCNPPSAVGELELVLLTGEPLRFEAVFRVERQGERITTKGIELNGQSIEGTSTPAVGTIDPDGDYRVEAVAPLSEFALLSRTFFDQPSSVVTGRFDLAADPVTLTSTSVGSQVFREGSATAQVFATCTGTTTSTAVRTGD
jgi:hypothetical protein